MFIFLNVTLTHAHDLTNGKKKKEKSISDSPPEVNHSFLVNFSLVFSYVFIPAISITINSKYLLLQTLYIISLKLS